MFGFYFQVMTHFNFFFVYIFLVCSGLNVCSGKPASANNAWPDPPWGNPQTPLTANKNTVSTAGNSFHSGTDSVGNWWQVDLGVPGFPVTEIRFRSRNDCCASQSSLLQIIMLDKVCFVYLLFRAFLRF